MLAEIGNKTSVENTLLSFEVNASDPNNDTLTYSLLSNVENITINVNSTTGIVNLTPSPDFFGVRYATFLANDSDNITFSNNVTLNITNVKYLVAGIGVGIIIGYLLIILLL